MGICCCRRVTSSSIPKVDRYCNQTKHEFTVQGIVNFLWAHATSGQIDHNLFLSLVPPIKANLSQCNAQGLTNISWAYAVANVDSPPVFNEEFINMSLQEEDEFELEGLCQLHQWQLWQDELKSGIILPPSLQKKCYNAFISNDPTPSKLQDDVISQYHLLISNQKKKCSRKVVID